MRALQGAYGRGARRRELLQLAATKMRVAGPPYSGVYMYMLDHGDLELEAHDGAPTPHTSIPRGKGLCGQAIAEDRDILVADVREAPGYLACSIETRSELIVLIRRGREVLGQIDVDSDLLNGFTAADQTAVKQVADALAALL